MSSVNEGIVREYFESLGFLVSQPRKYQVVARAKRPDEEIDLLVLNPNAGEQRLPEGMLWSAADLGGIARAIVGVRGWHTDRFSPGKLKLAPEVFRFAEADVVGMAPSFIGAGPLAKILCLPELPASATLQKQTLQILREHGIDGVILFRTMLLELAARVEVSKIYEKSDLLQVLRILKNYDLLKDAQLDLFKTKRKRKKVE